MTVRVMGDITEPIRPKRHLQSADTGMENVRIPILDGSMIFFCIALTNTLFYFPFRKIRTRK